MFVSVKNKAYRWKIFHEKISIAVYINPKNVELFVHNGL